MTLAEFFSEFERVASQPSGSISGQELLESLAGWDSLAVLEFMLMADEKLGLRLAPAQITDCARVRDLAVLCGLPL